MGSELGEAEERKEELSFASLDFNTFHLYFTAVCEELLRKIDEANETKVMLISEDECQHFLDHTQHLFALMEILVIMTKKNDKQVILACVIRFMDQFMSLFLDTYLPLLMKLLSRFNRSVMLIIKTVQRCTRQTQSLCSHAKITMDLPLINHVPKIKKLLEQFIYRIKEAMKKEGVEDAFWMGNLKNRYLDGKEVNEEQDKELSERKRKIISKEKKPKRRKEMEE